MTRTIVEAAISPMSSIPHPDRVVSILAEVAEKVIMPRFRRLGAGDVHEKGKADPVTIADREAEALLTEVLPPLAPGSVVVGEEAVAEAPTLLDRLEGDTPVWLVDPIDGTANFVAGRETFGVMVALVVRGEPVMAVIYAPVSQRTVTAVKGGGAFCDGVRLPSADSRDPVDPAALSGAVMTHFLPKNVADLLNQGAEGLGNRLRSLRSCAFEYPAIALGERDFALFGRTMPWDHAPGAVVLAETGGVLRFLDGVGYSPLLRRRGLLVARNAAVWDAVSQTLFPRGDPFNT